MLLINHPRPARSLSGSIPSVRGIVWIEDRFMESLEYPTHYNHGDRSVDVTSRSYRAWAQDPQRPLHGCFSTLADGGRLDITADVTSSFNCSETDHVAYSSEPLGNQRVPDGTSFDAWDCPRFS